MVSGEFAVLEVVRQVFIALRTANFSEWALAGGGAGVHIPRVFEGSGAGIGPGPESMTKSTDP
jgi:hypothetical protein